MYVLLAHAVHSTSSLVKWVSFSRHKSVPRWAGHRLSAALRCSVRGGRLEGVARTPHAHPLAHFAVRRHTFPGGAIWLRSTRQHTVPGVCQECVALADCAATFARRGVRSDVHAGRTRGLAAARRPFVCARLVGVGPARCARAVVPCFLGVFPCVEFETSGAGLCLALARRCGRLALKAAVGAHRALGIVGIFDNIRAIPEHLAGGAVLRHGLRRAGPRPVRRVRAVRAVGAGGTHARGGGTVGGEVRAGLAGWVRAAPYYRIRADFVRVGRAWCARTVVFAFLGVASGVEIKTGDARLAFALACCCRAFVLPIGARSAHCVIPRLLAAVPCRELSRRRTYRSLALTGCFRGEVFPIDAEDAVRIISAFFTITPGNKFFAAPTRFFLGRTRVYVQELAVWARGALCVVACPYIVVPADKPFAYLAERPLCCARGCRVFKLSRGTPRAGGVIRGTFAVPVKANRSTAFPQNAS